MTTFTAILTDANPCTVDRFSGVTAAEAWQACYAELVSRNDGDCRVHIDRGYVEAVGAVEKYNYDKALDAEMFWLTLCEIMRSDNQDIFGSEEAYARYVKNGEEEV